MGENLLKKEGKDKTATTGYSVPKEKKQTKHNPPKNNQPTTKKKTKPEQTKTTHTHTQMPNKKKNNQTEMAVLICDL